MCQIVPDAPTRPYQIPFDPTRCNPTNTLMVPPAATHANRSYAAIHTYSLRLLHTYRTHCAYFCPRRHAAFPARADLLATLTTFTVLTVLHLCSYPHISFDNLIILLILTTSGTMALETCELDPASDLALHLATINVVATSIFVAEMMAKILSLGLILPKQAAHTYIHIDTLPRPHPTQAGSTYIHTYRYSPSASSYPSRQHIHTYR